VNYGQVWPVALDLPSGPLIICVLAVLALCVGVGRTLMGSSLAVTEGEE
jgi:hypothetical protein